MHTWLWQWGHGQESAVHGEEAGCEFTYVCFAYTFRENTMKPEQEGQS